MSEKKAENGAKEIIENIHSSFGVDAVCSYIKEISYSYAIRNACEAMLEKYKDTIMLEQEKIKNECERIVDKINGIYAIKYADLINWVSIKHYWDSIKLGFVKSIYLSRIGKFIEEIGRCPIYQGIKNKIEEDTNSIIEEIKSVFGNTLEVREISSEIENKFRYYRNMLNDSEMDQIKYEYNEKGDDAHFSKYGIPDSLYDAIDNVVKSRLKKDDREIIAEIKNKLRVLVSNSERTAKQDLGNAFKEIDKL